MQRDIKKLEANLGVRFKDKNLLRSALVHRSYLNEHKNFTLEHNERLEFLGDAVLELAVTAYLYRRYSDPEGILTNWRSSLVNGERLAAIAEDLGVYNFLYLSKGEAKDSNKKARQYILANAFEAIVGAIYLDQGFRAADKFVRKTLVIQLGRIIKQKLYIDAKSRFQERAQEQTGLTPYYKVLSESGPDHHKKFVVGVFLEKEMIGKGEGYSKQSAQVQAAGQALEKKGWQ
ncbi:MAG: ribonuclease III [Patescibacteria group bacterium]|nr:ribonuclease III [Patescibacteria group bacterium]